MRAKNVVIYILGVIIIFVAISHHINFANKQVRDIKYGPPIAQQDFLTTVLIVAVVAFLMWLFTKQRK